MPPRRLTLAFAFSFAAAAVAAPLDDAVALFNEKKFPDAGTAFEKIAAADPTNAAAAYYLGLTLTKRGDPRALDDAAVWLDKAVALDPKNPRYLFDCGGVHLRLAQKNTSLGSASKGRELMEKTVALDPAHLDARESLYQYFSQAPFFAGGSNSKAKIQLEEIRRRDPDRGTVLEVISKANAKDYSAAFKICEESLAKNPASYIALYQYGRTAAISGQNLERGVTRLRECLALTPPTPASPSHSNVWHRIGNMEEKLKHPTEARTAYETALKLDAGNRQAADALAKYK